ncbi:hypothetical protein [Flavobacterium rhizosphaerae]|uniref:Uncharacterized protein n=1 Tax=Flavobacterium rhizosphaerae TaxID=3163298 RepID=A0ABW8YWQ8_9FLAO
MAEGTEHLDEILEGRFIRRVLTDYSNDVNLAQVQYIGSHNFSNADWISDRTFDVQENALQYSQKLKHRFVDMKFIGQGEARHKKKAHPIYNRIMWGHYNNIVRELAYGFTEAVKEDLRKLEG